MSWEHNLYENEFVNWKKTLFYLWLINAQQTTIILRLLSMYPRLYVFAFVEWQRNSP